MKAILNVHAKTSWSSMGHRDQTVDVPVQSRNRSQGKVPHCWGQLSELKKAVYTLFILPKWGDNWSKSTKFSYANEQVLKIWCTAW